MQNALKLQHQRGTCGGEIEGAVRRNAFLQANNWMVVVKVKVKAFRMEFSISVHLASSERACLEFHPQRKRRKHKTSCSVWSVVQVSVRQATATDGDDYEEHAIVFGMGFKIEGGVRGNEV